MNLRIADRSPSEDAEKKDAENDKTETTTTKHEPKISIYSLRNTAKMIKKLKYQEIYIATIHPNLNQFNRDINPKINSNMIELAGTRGIFKCKKNIKFEYDKVLFGFGYFWAPDWLVDYEEIL